VGWDNTVHVPASHKHCTLTSSHKHCTLITQALHVHHGSPDRALLSSRDIFRIGKLEASITRERETGILTKM
jgi:hypothetical protein